MKTFSPLLKINTKKQLRKGFLISFEFDEDLYGYAIIRSDYGSMWLLNVCSKSQMYVPDAFPEKHAFWMVGQLFAKLPAWALGEETKLSKRLVASTYINNGLNGPQVDSPKGLRPATKKDLEKYARDHHTQEIPIFAKEHLSEMEMINGRPGWRPVIPEELAAAIKTGPAEPSGKRQIEIHVPSFNDTLITEREDLEEAIQEAIGDDGFVSGGGSMVGADGQEGGDVEVECDDETFKSVMRKIRKVLVKFKAPPDTLLVDIVLMDDGTSKETEHLLGSS